MLSKIKSFFEEHALMVSGMLLMLASAGVDGAFLAAWMTPGMAFMGYILNLVADSSSYVIAGAYGRLQNDDDEDKRKLSKILLVGELVNIAYSWLFGYLVLRDRFLSIFTRSIFGNVNTELEILAFVSAGFVPLTLTFLGYADSLNKSKPKRRQVVKPIVSNTVEIDAEPVNPVSTLDKARSVKADNDLTTKQARLDKLLSIYRDDPFTSPSTIAEAVGVSRQTVYKYLSELEETGAVHNNGDGVKVLL